MNDVQPMNSRQVAAARKLILALDAFILQARTDSANAEKALENADFVLSSLKDSHIYDVDLGKRTLGTLADNQTAIEAAKEAGLKPESLFGELEEEA